MFEILIDSSGVVGLALNPIAERISNGHNYHLEHVVEDAFRAALDQMVDNTQGVLQADYEAVRKSLLPRLKPGPQFPTQITTPLLTKNIDALRTAIWEMIEKVIPAENADSRAHVQRDLPDAFLYAFSERLKHKKHAKGWIAFQRECWWELSKKLDNAPQENLLENAYDDLVEKIDQTIKDALETQQTAIESAFKKALENQHRPQAYDPLLDGEVDGGRVDRYRQAFSYKSRLTEYIWPTEAAATVHDFLHDERRFSWALFLEKAGAGKSRFGLEWVERLKANGRWDAFFFDVGRNENYDHWRDWQPEADTLIIFDYAYQGREAIKKAVNALHQRQSGLQHKIRFLLLEREAMGRFLSQELSSTARFRGSQKFDDVNPLQALAGGRGSVDTGQDYFEIDQLTPIVRERLLIETYRQFVEPAKAKDRDFGASIVELDAEELKTPLWAMLAGFALAHADNSGSGQPKLNQTELLQAIFDRETDLLENLAGTNAPEKVAHAVAVASACGVYQRRAGVDDQTGLNKAFLQGYSLFGNYDSDAMAMNPALPDLIAEAFVLFVLDQKVVPNCQPQLKQSVEAAIRGCDSEHRWDFAARAVQNYPELYQRVLKPLLPEGSEGEWLVEALGAMGQSLSDEELESKTNRAIVQGQKSGPWMGYLGVRAASGDPRALEQGRRLWQRLWQRLSEEARGGYRGAFAELLVNSLARVPMTVEQRLSITNDLKALWESSQEPKIRLIYAQGLLNAIEPDMTVEQRLSITNDLKALWEASQEPEIRLEYAQGLVNAIRADMTVEQRLSITNDLKALWESSQEPEIRLRYAQGLVNAIEPDMTVEQRLSITNDLKALWEASQEPEIRLIYAQGLVNAIRADMTVERRLSITNDLKALWEASQEPEIRLIYAQGLVNAIIIAITTQSISQNDLENLNELISHVQEHVDHPDWQPVLEATAAIVQYLHSMASNSDDPEPAP